jgi:hypothetical protein
MASLMQTVPEGMPPDPAQLEKWNAWHADLAERNKRAYQKLARIAGTDEAARRRADKRRLANVETAEKLATENAREGQVDALLSDARQVAANAAASSFTRLTKKQTEKLELVHERLLDFMDERRPGENDAVMDMVERARRLIDGAITTASFFSTMAKPPAKCREAWVWGVAIVWNRHTGQDCTVSRDGQRSGSLTKTPLVCFVRAILSDVLPTLKDGEIQRGIEGAGAQLEARDQQIAAQK